MAERNQFQVGASVEYNVEAEQPITGPPRKLARVDPSPTTTSVETTTGDMIEVFGRLDVRQVMAAALILRCAFLELEDLHDSVVKSEDIGNPCSVRRP